MIGDGVVSESVLASIEFIALETGSSRSTSSKLMKFMDDKMTRLFALKNAVTSSSAAQSYLAAGSHRTTCARITRLSEFSKVFFNTTSFVSLKVFRPLTLGVIIRGLP
jgi:hypothetical protein